jgi:hypothetical protein
VLANFNRQVSMPAVEPLLKGETTRMVEGGVKATIEGIE